MLIGLKTRVEIVAYSSNEMLRMLHNVIFNLNILVKIDMKFSTLDYIANLDIIWAAILS